MRVSILPLVRRPAIDALEQGDIDFALGFAWGLPRNIKQTNLFDEGYSVVMRQGHPLAQQPMTLKAYANAEHRNLPGGKETDTQSSERTGIPAERWTVQGRRRG